MPPREWQLRVTDMLDSIARIERYVADMSFEMLEADERTVDAVVRNLEIIGEAARHVPNSIKDQHPEVPWRHANRLRNFAIQQYPDVDLAVIWDTIKSDLPPMVPLLEAMLAEPPETTDAP